MTEQVLTTNHAGIFRLQINRPEKKNALTIAMYQAMTESLRAAETLSLIHI